MEAKEISTGTKSKDDARPTKEPKNSEDYSGTKSKDDAHPTKEPKNSEGKKVPKSLGFIFALATK